MGQGDPGGGHQAAVTAVATAPRPDRQIMAVAMGGSAVLLALTVTLRLMALLP